MRVAVLRGGPSNEYEESLSSGEQILNILRSQPGKYEPLDIFIDKNGQWHRAGVAIAPEKVLQHVDVVFNALHGRYGEDGQVQRLLVAHGIPYTGSGHINSALSRQPHLARQNLVKAGLRVPRHKVLDGGVSLELVRKIFRAYMHPIIVSPVVNGTAYDKRVVMSFQELAEAIAEAFRHSSQVMVEEAVRGKEVNCGILEKMRGQDTYALLPCPQQTNLAQNRKIEGMARQAHQSLGLKHYSMSKFVITPQGNIYIIDTRPHPPLHKDSPFIESLYSVGISPRDCVTHLINLAVEN